MPGGSLVSPCSLGPPQAKTKGNKVNVGVKYAEKQERRFEPEKLREGRNIIGLQVLPLLHRGVLLLSWAGRSRRPGGHPGPGRLWGTGCLALPRMYAGRCAWRPAALSGGCYCYTLYPDEETGAWRSRLTYRDCPHDTWPRWGSNPGSQAPGLGATYRPRDPPFLGLSVQSGA